MYGQTDKSKLTKNGIAYNLKESPYVVVCGKIHYVFSSELYKKKFMDRIRGYRQEVNEKLSNKYKLDVSFDTLAELSLYKQIEKRGFLIRTYDPIKCEVIDICDEKVRLDGQGRIRRL